MLYQCFYQKISFLHPTSFFYVMGWHLEALVCDMGMVPLLQKGRALGSRSDCCLGEGGYSVHFL